MASYLSVLLWCTQLLESVTAEMKASCLLLTAELPCRRALAALLKELSKTGLREVAFEIFDWLRTLDEQVHPEYAGLLDVFTYTTMIVSAKTKVALRPMQLLLNLL